MNIGLALSGGGVRALIYHLGILKRLAETKNIENVTQISTVSGGSLAIALVYRFNNYVWPSGKQFLDEVLPQIKKLLTTRNLKLHLILQSVLRGYIIRPKGDILAKMLKSIWGINANIGILDKSPTWWINSTCYESGVNWRFSQESVGDYVIGKSTESESIQISLAIAASAAFPGLIGPIIFKPTWGVKSKIHLWDGGVYDNLGMEVLWKPNSGLQKDLDVLFVSDGGQKIRWRRRLFITALFRLIDIPISQVRSLRSRIFIDFLLKNNLKGVYFQIGNTVKDIFNKANTNYSNNMIDTTLSKTNVNNVSNFPTTLRKVTIEEYDRIILHGFEVANATLHAYMGEAYIL